MNAAPRFSFDSAGLDRAAHLRSDTVRLLADPKARILPIWRGKPLVQGEEGAALGWLSLGQAAPVQSLGEPIFLGLSDGVPHFARDVSPWEPAVYDADALDRFVDQTQQVHPELPEGTHFAELRAVMTRLSSADAELAAVARALTQWHQSHQFCSSCGVKSALSDGGWQRVCPSCGAHHFPRTDPVVIMLITHGNRALIGRNSSWPEGMYSLLAGFVEPGERPEDAVRREVLEEAGIEVGPVRYLASQPWPFPTQLMTAWHGEALHDLIQIDPTELEEARWISREEMAVALRGDHPEIKAARSGAIARAVLDAWVSDRLDQFARDRAGAR